MAYYCNIFVVVSLAHKKIIVELLFETNNFLQHQQTEGILPIINEDEKCIPTA
jgi:hypothetical protein